MGANGIIQGALESILAEQPASFFDETVDIIKVTMRARGRNVIDLALCG